MLRTLFLLLKAKKGGNCLNSIFKYTENNGDVIITGLKEGVSDTSIVIPETIDGMPVTAIGAKAFEFTSITDIKIGANIRKIGNEAFSYCAKLIAVRWNCKCNAIPDYCFLECSNLTSFDFSSIKKIGIYAFGVSGLQEVCLPKNIEIISTGTFSRCNGLRSVTWNGTCDVIPADCFAFCSNLTNFDFSAIKKIGRYAFWRSGLQEVCLPKNIECISERAFGGCNELRSVIWNGTCDVIPAACFAFCSNLTNFDFSNIKKIGQYSFWESGLISVTLSKGTAVYQSCFAFCESLTKVEWLSARSIKEDIFKECKDIKEIYISDKVKNFEAKAFVSSPNEEINFV